MMSTWTCQDRFGLSTWQVTKALRTRIKKRLAHSSSTDSAGISGDRAFPGTVYFNSYWSILSPSFQFSLLPRQDALFLHVQTLRNLIHGIPALFASP